MAMQKNKHKSPSSLAVRIRTSTRKAFPKLNLSELDPQMIQTFLKAMNDNILTTTVLTNDVRDFKKVVEVATRLDLAAGTAHADAIVSKKPSVFQFQAERKEMRWTRLPLHT